MALCNLSEIPNHLKKGQCLLGLDPGSVVLGIAVSDPSLAVASPLTSLSRKKFKDDALVIIQIIKDRNIGGIVVGLPLNMNGTEGPSAQSVRTFVSNLLKHQNMPNLPVAFWDERFSSAAVERFLISDDISRGRRDEVIDKLAAAYILQGALDRIRNS